MMDIEEYQKVMADKVRELELTDYDLQLVRNKLQELLKQIDKALGKCREQ